MQLGGVLLRHNQMDPVASAGSILHKGPRFAPSAVVNIKNPSIVDFVRDGTIDRIEASGIRGELGDAVLSPGRWKNQ